MFLIFGVEEGSKQILFRQRVLCPVCGRYGDMTVWMTYTYFMFFFVPLFKWNRRYYVKMECCGAGFEIPVELGRDIKDKKITDIDPSKLEFSDPVYGPKIRRCPDCGFETTEDYYYCPKCGSLLE